MNRGDYYMVLVFQEGVLLYGNPKITWLVKVTYQSRAALIAVCDPHTEQKSH